MVKQQHQLFVALLCLMDGLVVACACAAAWAVRRMTVEEFWPLSWETYFKEPLFIFAIPVALYAMRIFGLYLPRRDRSIWNEQAQLVKVSLFSLGALIVVLWTVGNALVGGNKVYGPAHLWGLELDAGRVQLGSLAVALPLFLGLHRAAFRLVLRGIRKRGRNLRHVAIIGVERLGQIACHTIGRNTWTGLNVGYFISHHDQNKRTNCLDLPVMGGLDDLERILDENPVDAVYLAIPNTRAAVVPRVLQRLDRFAVDVRIVPDVHPRFVPQSMVVGDLDGMPVLSYRECPSSGLGGMSKRALDMAGAFAGLLVFLPVMAAVALAVRLTSPGPVIFKQRRVSLGAKTFKIYKFRTMYHVEDEDRVASVTDSDAPATPGGVRGWTERNDPRITPVGRWLRRTSLDELPQLLNVLKGQMSLVGPRPERPELIERFREDWRGYMLRQHVKAGITGWAQVNGLRGQTSLKKRIQYDLFYVKHWSLWFDLRILWLTVFRGFVHRNAH